MPDTPPDLVNTVDRRAELVLLAIVFAAASVASCGRVVVADAPSLYATCVDTCTTRPLCALQTPSIIPCSTQCTQNVELSNETGCTGALSAYLGCVELDPDCGSCAALDAALYNCWNNSDAGGAGTTGGGGAGGGGAGGAACAGGAGGSP